MTINSSPREITPIQYTSGSFRDKGDNPTMDWNPYTLDSELMLYFATILAIINTGTILIKTMHTI